jgi:hypothetical protein
MTRTFFSSGENCLFILSSSLKRKISFVLQSLVQNYFVYFLVCFVCLYVGLLSCKFSFPNLIDRLIYISKAYLKIIDLHFVWNKCFSYSYIYIKIQCCIQKRTKCHPSVHLGSFFRKASFWPSLHYAWFEHTILDRTIINSIIFLMIFFKAFL